MALQVQTLRDAARPAVVIAGRRLWLTADRSAIVEDGDPRAAFLLAGEGSEIPPAEVRRLGLDAVDGMAALPWVDAEPEPEMKARAAPANKARRKGADKSKT